MPTRLIVRPEKLDLDSPGRRDYWVALEHDSLWGDHLIPLTVFVGPKAKAGEGLDWALREAAVLLVQMMGPLLPHLAEDCWQRLGYNTLLADQAWPEAEPALLVDDQITIAVQVNGKRRDEIAVARTASNAEIEAAVLGLESVARALAGRPVKKVIIVPQRIVNVVG